jgi:hypothetical protein
VCKLANAIDGADLPACLATTTSICSTLDTKLVDYRARRKLKIDKVCGALLPLGDVTPFIGGLGYGSVAAACSAASTTALTDCLLGLSRCAAEHEVFRRDPRALDSLTEVGIAASFPCVGPPP